MRYFTSLKVYILIFSLLNTSILAVESTKFNIKEFTLPSEVQNIPKSTGAMFYSPSIKGKVLIPVHFWGEVKKSGLHFVPVNTSVINGISMAGGPSSNAELDNVKLTRKLTKGFEVRKYNLEGGGATSLYSESLKPGDSIFVPKDTYFEDRAYYTSLIGVFTTVLSSILLFREVKKD